MASLKFHSAKTHSFPDFTPSKSQSNPLLAGVAVSGEESQRRCRRHRVFAVSPPCSRQLSHRSSDQPRRDVNPAELERWVKGSVEEIVRNLEGASPLVVEVYAGDGKARFKAEKAAADEWAALREELERKCPDGLIFVEQLCDGGDGGADRCWGIVIQGRDCAAPVCYLLKTCRAAAAAGMVLSCTHFCLVKVKSFRESAFGQFKNSWLAK
ncbi:PREDICTED: uncharacterized protein LOC109179309 [Ipomoea nil]|uniref:uncharacterized protein LOC109179309 n=1 Tax=Ipomoea nil TaxID=35883 RepID=UPI000900FE0F|nr:PREDICTED: uncharacterized protein LOC109179309 [Ipomoea nil]